MVKGGQKSLWPLLKVTISMPLIDAQTLVRDVLAAHPQTAAVFLQHDMLCVGCLIAPFHTLAEACDEHDLDETAFLTDVSHAISAGPSLV